MKLLLPVNEPLFEAPKSNVNEWDAAVVIIPACTASVELNSICAPVPVAGLPAAADAPSKLKLFRDSTEIEEYGYQGYLGSASLMHMGAYQHFDSPSTTSATTYKVTFNSVNGHNVLCQYDDSGGDGISSMLLMEIAQWK